MIPRRALFLLFALLLFAGLPLGCTGLDGWGRDTADASGGRKTTRHGDTTDMPTPRISAKTHLAAGQVLERQNKLAAAVEQYEKAISTDPRLVAAYNRLGITYEKMKRVEDGERVFRQGLEAVPDAAVLRNNLGYSLMLRNRLEAAEKEFRLALDSSPKFTRARMNLAITLARTRRPEASLAQFKKAVPEDAAHYNVGLICLDLRDYDAAEHAFRTALAINPECKGAREFLERTVQIANRTRSPTDDKQTSEAGMKLAGPFEEDSAVSPVD